MSASPTTTNGPETLLRPFLFLSSYAFAQTCVGACSSVHPFWTRGLLKNEQGFRRPSSLTPTLQSRILNMGFSTTVGCLMRLRKILPLTVLGVTSFLISCSGAKNGPCVTNCGGSNATL